MDSHEMRRKGRCGESRTGQVWGQERREEMEEEGSRETGNANENELAEPQLWLCPGCLCGEGPLKNCSKEKLVPNRRKTNPNSCCLRVPAKGWAMRCRASGENIDSSHRFLFPSRMAS